MTLEDDKNHLEANPVPTSSREIIRVLHIDDDENVQMFLKVFIEEDLNIKVTSVQNAEDALQLILTGAFDCFVNDYLDGTAPLAKVSDRIRSGRSENQHAPPRARPSRW